MVPRTRREALQRSGSAVLALLAGCVAGQENGSGGSPAGTPTNTATDEPTPRAVSPGTDTPWETPTTGDGPPATDDASTPSTTPVTDGVAATWTADLDGVLAYPAATDDTVVVPSMAGPVYALDPDDGGVRWRVPEGGGSRYVAPAIADGVVYVGGDGTLHALDAADGTERWSREWEGSMTTSPVVHDGAVVVGNSDPPTSHTESAYPHDLWALDAADGSVRWRRDLGTGEHDLLGGAPAVANGTLYAQVDGSGIVYALDPADGTTRWRTPVDGGIGYVSIDSGRVFAPSGDGIVALGAATGEERWRADGLDTVPVAADGIVYAGAWGTRAIVRAFDADGGGERWRIERPGELRAFSAIEATPDAALVNVFHAGREDALGDNTTVLHALDPSTGDVRWRFGRRAGLFGRPTRAGGRTYVGSASGTLYALDG